jgi:hypothetical protein
MSMTMEACGEVRQCSGRLVPPRNRLPDQDSAMSERLPRTLRIGGHERPVDDCKYLSARRRTVDKGHQIRTHRPGPRVAVSALERTECQRQEDTAEALSKDYGSTLPHELRLLLMNLNFQLRNSLLEPQPALWIVMLRDASMGHLRG